MFTFALPLYPHFVEKMGTLPNAAMKMLRMDFSSSLGIARKQGGDLKVSFSFAFVPPRLLVWPASPSFGEPTHPINSNM